MKKINNNEAINLNGGKTYVCPFKYDHQGSFTSVYWHILSKGCFKVNKTLNALWTSGTSLIKIGAKLGGFIK